MKIQKFQSFKVSGFRVSQVWKFQIFKVSKFQNFKNSISCLFIEIDPMSKMSKNLLDRTSRCLVRAFSKLSKRPIFEMSRFPKIIFPKNEPGVFLNYLELYNVVNIRNNWFGESGSRPAGPKIINIMICLAFPK